MRAPRFDLGSVQAGIAAFRSKARELIAGTRRSLEETIASVRRQGPPSGTWLIAALTLVMVLMGSGLEPPWRRAWFDFEHNLFPRERSAVPAVIVAIDDKSLEEVGQWPWPRDVHAQLLDAVVQAGAASVAFDVLFAEPDRSSPRNLAERFESQFPDTAAALRQLPDSDAALAAALGRSYSILAVSGANSTEGVQTDPIALKAPPILLTPPQEGDAVTKDPPADTYPELLRNRPELDAAAAGHGAISVRLPHDAVLRRAPAVQRIDGVLYPFLSLEALRVAPDAPWLDATVDARGFRQLSMSAQGASIVIPLQRDGAFWPYFGRYDPTRYVSAADILSGEAAPDAVAGKVVFIGATAVALEDRKTFPIAVAPLPGVEAHMQVVEAALAGAFLHRPVILFWMETVGFIVAAVLFGWFIPRQKPTRSLIALGAALLVMMGGALLFFRYGALLLDAATPSLALVVYALPTLGLSLIETSRERRRAEAALAEERVTRARFEGELNAARVIQMSMVPKEPLIAAEHGVAIHGLMEPALQVGGDFYDYFLVEDDRLFFTIGDVSDKGVPASLFMALAKSLWKSIVLRDPSDLEKIQVQTNDEITRDNREQMFFTGLAGVIDLRSLEVKLSCAGHDLPYLRRRDGSVIQIEGESSMPMGVLEEIDYPVITLSLEPGDTMVMFTDGVSEALNPEGEFYGLERIQEVLEERDIDGDGATVVAHVKSRLDAFVNGAPQSDDVTILTLAIDSPPKT